MPNVVELARKLDLLAEVEHELGSKYVVEVLLAGWDVKRSNQRRAGSCQPGHGSPRTILS